MSPFKQCPILLSIGFLCFFDDFVKFTAEFSQLSYPGTDHSIIKEISQL